MNIQQHERISRIKKLSRYLYRVLTGVGYLFWVLWPMAVIVTLIVDSTTTIKILGDIEIKLIEMNLLQRTLLVLFISIFFFFQLKVIYYCRELTRHFSIGDIFNKKALENARKALLYALAIYGLELISLLIHWIYQYFHNPVTPFVFDFNIIFGLMLFGLMYIVLWTIEIGADINEESELTI